MSALIPEVIARLDATVAPLAGRVAGASSFTDLLNRKALPQQTPAAHVLPGPLRGGEAGAVAGAFTQMLGQTISVLLTVRTFDRTGAQAMAGIDTLIREIIEALAGWGPADAIGVFELSRGLLVSMQAGTLVYQIDFAITEQLRIFA